jgi:LysR family transcriptional regulator, glycine cleavage system transcriptional activator
MDVDSGPVFDSSAFAQQAAIDGLGIAMRRIPLVDEYLESRCLVAPFRERRRTENSWYLVFPKATVKFRKVKIFASWIMEEAGKSSFHVGKGTGRDDVRGLHVRAALGARA